MTPPFYFFDLTREQLRQMVVDWGMPAYRADQLLEWVYRKQIVDPQQMTNLSKADRRRITEAVLFTRGRILQHLNASDGTQKLLVEWDSGSLSRRGPRERASDSLSRAGEGGFPEAADRLQNPSPGSAAGGQPPSPLEGRGEKTASPPGQTECVMIPADPEPEDHSTPRRTACISSQVGCPVGCRFCASGLGGLEGNLSSGQIVEQVWRLSTLPGVGRISHVVFMGMGEPLANFEAVTAALGTLMAPWGMGISGRRITISTVGLPAQIRRLAELGLPVTLAISLHAPNDELRRQLIPWAQYVSIEQLVATGSDYFDRTGREVTLEYILLHEVNDRPEHARELAQVARTLRSNVNLIRYNEIEGLPFGRPEDASVRQFQEILRRAGVNAHIRASRGRDIAAACGQLRHEHMADESVPVKP